MYAAFYLLFSIYGNSQRSELTCFRALKSNGNGNSKVFDRRTKPFHQIVLPVSYTHLNYLVKPVAGSWELSSADRIEVPIRNAHPSPEPEVGDVIEIRCV